MWMGDDRVLIGVCVVVLAAIFGPIVVVLIRNPPTTPPPDVEGSHPHPFAAAGRHDRRSEIAGRRGNRRLPDSQHPPGPPGWRRGDGRSR